VLFSNFKSFKKDSAGNEIWVARYKNTLNSSDEAKSVCLDNSGNIYVSGSNYDFNSSAILTIKYSFNVGLEELQINEKNNLNIFPNPFKTSFIIKFDNYLINAELEIYDMLGRKVINIKDLNENEINIQRNNMIDGIYFFRVNEKNKTIAKGKIIAE
jgi:hypothetical protein